MNLRRDFLFTLGGLIGVNLLFAFACIGLFTRMGPAIEKILQENMHSIQAAEEMLFILAGSNGRPVNAADGEQFRQAFLQARFNVTEPEEKPALEKIEQHMPAALNGDSGARTEVIASIRKLIEINHEAMGVVDREAQRLGMAGAWSAVFLAVISFAVSLIIHRRMERKIIFPMTELQNVLQDIRTGNSFRRCSTVDTPLDVRRVLHDVNRLLDERYPVDDGTD